MRTKAPPCKNTTKCMDLGVSESKCTTKAPNANAPNTKAPNAKAPPARRIADTHTSRPPTCRRVIPIHHIHTAPPHPHPRPIPPLGTCTLTTVTHSLHTLHKHTNLLHRFTPGSDGDKSTSLHKHLANAPGGAFARCFCTKAPPGTKAPRKHLPLPTNAPLGAFVGAFGVKSTKTKALICA